jgi:hypothetical protein
VLINYHEYARLKETLDVLSDPIALVNIGTHNRSIHWKPESRNYSSDHGETARLRFMTASG